MSKNDTAGRVPRTNFIVNCTIQVWSHLLTHFTTGCFIDSIHFSKFFHHMSAHHTTSLSKTSLYRRWFPYFRAPVFDRCHGASLCLCTVHVLDRGTGHQPSRSRNPSGSIGASLSVSETQHHFSDFNIHVYICGEVQFPLSFQSAHSQCSQDHRLLVDGGGDHQRGMGIWGRRIFSTLSLFW